VARGYQQSTATRTVDRCRELGYVGDERLADERARALRARGAGSLKIASDLEGRGLSEAIIARAIEESRDGEAEAVWARRALERQGRPRGAKAWRLLASRGFPEEVVRDVLGEPGEDPRD
jgi:SOS response regulatory protein OraA/RecX